MIEKITLSPNEIRTNKSEFYKMLVVVIIIFVIICTVGVFVLIESKSTMSKLIFGVIFSVLFFTFLPMVKGSYKDLISKVKLKVSGNVKAMHIKESSSSSSTIGGMYGGGKSYSSGSSSSGSTSKRYFVTIDDLEVQVEALTYNSLKIGNFASVIVSEGSLVEMK